MDKAPKGAGFRVAGRWLGYLFPSDFNGKVVFDEPTGGELDLAVIERELMETTELLPEGSDPIAFGRWSKLAAKRLRWARKRLAAAEKAKRTPRKGAKSRSTRAKRTAEPAKSPEPVAVSSSKREEENDMGAKKSKKKSTGKKKATAKEAAAKKTAAKKTAAKKTTAKKTTAKKTTAKKTTAKNAAKKKAKKAAKKKVTAKKATSKKATAKKPSSTTVAAPAKPAANGKAAKPEAERDRPRRRLRFKRNDIVRFRKRSQIAAGLGVGLDKEFKVEMVSTEDGRTMVVLRVGEGKHSALIKVPPGHLAIVSRGGEVPPPIRACAARLARFKGPITPKTRRLLAELAGSV